MRLWRSDFARGGVEALKTSPAPGPPPVKAEAALRVAPPLLEAPVADRRNWTVARLIGEIEAREGRHHFQIASVQDAAQKKFRWRRPRHTLKGRQGADAVDRVVDIPRRLSPHWVGVHQDLSQARFGARRAEVHQAMLEALSEEGWLG